MSRDVLERLTLFSQDEGAELDVHRIALNMDQIESLKPPKNPAKITDSRAAAYIGRFGRSSWELDAIEPAQLARLVRRAVTRLIDAPLWEASGRREESGRAELEAYADNYGSQP